MPVYLLTAHAYRSWHEDHRKGYVQCEQGLKDPSERNVGLHSAAATQSHVHILISFRSPAFTCGAAKCRRRGCPGQAFAEKVIVRMCE